MLAAVSSVLSALVLCGCTASPSNEPVPAPTGKVQAEVTALVDVDFSQFYLVSGDAFFGKYDYVDGMERALGLCDASSRGAAMFTTVRHDGPVAVTVQVFDSEPPPLDATWQDVVEVPFEPVGEVRVKGWDPASTETVIPIAAAGGDRIRYAIADADRADSLVMSETGRDLPEEYLIQIWPARPARAAVIRQDSAIGQYWGFNHERRDIASRVAGLPEQDRFRAAVDFVLAEHPETAAKIRGGDHRFTIGIVSATYDVKPKPESRDDVQALIVERAQRMK
jgi:hypothetical protein